MRQAQMISKTKMLTSIITLSGALLLGGCATSMQAPQDKKIDTANLENLQQLTNNSTPTGATVGRIRLDAIKDTALTLGAQGGLAARAKQINQQTLQNSASLDQIFNFNRLILDNNVLPPVLVEASQSMNLNSSTAIRLSGQIYKIIQQAQFVTTAPNWRQYLLLDFSNPTVPDSTLLPKNHAERTLWNKYIQEGWQQGIQQANNIYRDNLARLQRDFKGMILYRKLLAENIVSSPYVAKTNLGVTSNKDHSQLYINDRVMRITALPQLNPNSSSWKPIVETNDGTKPASK